MLFAFKDNGILVIKQFASCRFAWENISIIRSRLRQRFHNRIQACPQNRRNWGAEDKEAISANKQTHMLWQQGNWRDWNKKKLTSSLISQSCLYFYPVRSAGNKCNGLQNSLLVVQRPHTQTPCTRQILAVAAVFLLPMWKHSCGAQKDYWSLHHQTAAGLSEIKQTFLCNPSI